MKAELLDHRKFLRLKRLLGEPTPHVLGYLMLMWRRGYQTGDARLGDELDVEAAAEYMGEPGKFAIAANQAGFLDRLDDGSYAIHDLYDHAPKYAQLRMARRGTAPSGAMPSHSEKGSHEPVSGSCEPKTARKRFARTTKVRGKSTERREEESLPAEVICSEPPKTATHEPENAGSPEAVLTYPTVGPVKSWHLLAGHVQTWQDAYPGLDVLAECRKALAWVVSNPAKTKTAKGMTAFLNSWLARANDRPRSGPAPPAARPPEKLLDMQRHTMQTFLDPPPPPGEPSEPDREQRRADSQALPSDTRPPAALPVAARPA